MQRVAGYRGCNSDELSEKDSSNSDSDGDYDWKRNRPKPSALSKMPKNGALPSMEPCFKANSSPCTNETFSASKRKVNNVWSSVLQEQVVTDVLKDCKLKHKPIVMQDRSCESYDFELKYSDPRDALDEKGDMETDCVDESNGDVQNGSVSKKKMAPLKIKRDDILVAKKICRVLNEKKQDLIERVVHVLGADKAMELLKNTEDVEDQGGMQTKNMARRRTPGGVYLQLVKADSNITKQQKKVIFAEEMNYVDFLKKKYINQKKRMKRRSKKKLNEEMDFAISLSTTCESSTALESVTKETVQATVSSIADVSQESPGSELEDGEIPD